VDAVQQRTDPVANPTGNAFWFAERDLLSVSQAQRMAAPEVNRVWRIKNPGAINPYRWAAQRLLWQGLAADLVVVVSAASPPAWRWQIRL
jgi:Cu2+-containing amine oxidase